MIQINAPISSHFKTGHINACFQSLSPIFFHCSTIVFMIFHAMSHINSSERKRTQRGQGKEGRNLHSLTVPDQSGWPVPI